MSEENKCSNCGKELTKIAIRKELGKGFEYKELGICSKCANKIVLRPYIDENNKRIWKNLLLPDFQTIAMVIIILFMLWAFKNDTAICQNAVKSPCVFCATTGCYNPKTKCSYIDSPELENLSIDYKGLI